MTVVQLASAAVQLSKAALSLLDLRQHTATHPRLGVVDHIVCNPLGAQAELSSAAEAAQRIGRPSTLTFGQVLLSVIRTKPWHDKKGRTALQKCGMLQVAQNTLCWLGHTNATRAGAAVRLRGLSMTGQSLGQGEHAVPVLLYGAAHAAGQTLASIRRASGYFKGSGTGKCSGQWIART